MLFTAKLNTFSQVNAAITLQKGTVDVYFTVTVLHPEVCILKSASWSTDSSVALIEAK